MTATVTKLKHRPWTEPGDAITTQEDALAALLWLKANAKHVRVINEKARKFVSPHIIHNDEWWGCGTVAREVKANLTLAEITNILVEAGVKGKALQAVRTKLQDQGVGSTKAQEYWTWRRLHNTETKAKLIDPPKGMTNKKGERIS